MQQLRDLPTLLRHLSRDFLTLPASSFLTVLRLRSVSLFFISFPHSLSLMTRRWTG